MKSLDAAILRESFSAFVLRAFRQTHDQRLGPQPYVQHLCNEITKFIDGKTKRLLINLPPQHLKTFVGSICLPAYLLGKNPRLRIILTAYNDTLAEDLCEKIREMMKSAWYKQVFASRIKGGHSRTNDFATEETVASMRYPRQALSRDAPPMSLSTTIHTKSAIGTMSGSSLWCGTILTHSSRGSATR